MPPDDPFGAPPSFIPNTMWADEYRNAGGVTIQDRLSANQEYQQVQAEQAQQYQDAQQSRADAESNAALQAQWSEASKNFVDWPTFQQLAEGTEATKQYDGYLEALAWQLEQMGYAPEEAQQEIAQFQKMVARPAEDFGFFGNLYESAKGGMQSGTRAIETAAAAGMGDGDKMAALAAESAGSSRNAALTNFQQAVGGDENTTAWEVVKNIAAAGVQEPQGMLNFFVEQIAQSYPVIASSIGLGAAGTLAGPVGTVAGVAGGAMAGSTALDTGATILESLVKEAQERGIDPNDKAALQALMREPGVKERVVQDGLAHGVPVGLMDGAIAALSFGVGASVARSVRAGSKLGAAGKVVGGLALDTAGGAGGEALGQLNQFGRIADPTGVGLEAAGSIGPGVAGMGMGALNSGVKGLRKPVAPPVLPPNVGHSEETDLAGFDANPELTVAAEQAELQLKQVLVEELPLEQIDLQTIAESQPPTYEVNEEIDLQPAGGLPTYDAQEVKLLPAPQNPTLGVTPGGRVGPPAVLEAEREQQRLAALAPQVGSVDPSDFQSLADRMAIREIDLSSAELTGALDLIAGAPKTMKQEAIASVIENLNTADPNIDAFALELIRIAHQLQPRPKVTAAQARTAINAIAVDLGTTPDQVVPIVAQALAEEIVNAVTTTQPAAETDTDPRVITKRGLLRGESIPAANLASLAGQLSAGGPVQGQGAGNETQGQPRRGLRARVSAQGPVALGDQGRSSGSAGAPNTGVVTNDTGSTRTVRGFQYGVEGTKDVANTDALQRMKDDALAKAETGGLSQKAKKGIRKKPVDTGPRSRDLVAMTKEEYEKTYPGRDYDADLNEIILPDDSAPVAGTDTLSPSAIRTLQLSPFNSIMEYLSAVMPMPLQRLVAQQLERLDLQIPVQVGTLPGTKKGNYLGANGGLIVIDPAKGTLNTVLHEAVHAATAAALIDPQTEKQRVAGARMRELYEYTKQQLPNSTQYGLKNVFEFVAEAFANPGFQKDLQALPLPNPTKYGGLKNVLDMFKRLVLRLLGLNTSDNVLSEALLAGSDLFSNRKVAVDIELAQQGATAPSSAMVGVKNGARTFIAYTKDGKEFTLYPTTAQEPRGIKGAGRKLSRADAEAAIKAQGSEVLPPVDDTRPAPGVPTTSSTKLVGFSPEGDLQVAAYEQKDGTWTYYESDQDVRSDPNAKVYKGLSKAAAERYLAAKGVQTTAPKPNAVQPNGSRPSVLWKAPKAWEINWANSKQPWVNIGQMQQAVGDKFFERTDVASVLANSNADTKIRSVLKQYIEPVAAAGKKLMQQFNKVQTAIETDVQALHVVERMENKKRQFYKGNLEPIPLKEKLDELQAKVDAAKLHIQGLDPRYVTALKQELAPKLKALSDNTLDTAVQYGFIDRDAAEAMKQAYDYYVPLQTGERTTVGKVAKGSATSGDLTFARMQQQAYSTILRGEANRPVELAARLVEAGRLVDRDGNPVATVGSGLRIYWDAKTNSLNEGVDSHIFAENAVPFYRGGQRLLMVTDDEAILAAAGPYKGPQKKTAITTMLGIAGAITQTMAIGKTALSPAFSSFNLPRDIFMATVNIPKGVSRVNFAKHLVDPRTMLASFYNVFKEAFGGEMQGQFGEARDAGAFISQRAYIGLDVMAKAIETAFSPTMQQTLKKGGRGIFKILVGLSQAIESTPRYAMYKAALDTPGMTKEEAAMAGKTASINFENRGLNQKWVSPLYMFANAKLQGLHAVIKLAERSSGTQVAVFSAGMIMLGFLAAAAGMKYSEKDRDGRSKYQKIPDYRKDSMILFTEGGKGIPLPQEIAPLYVWGNAIGELAYGGKTLGEASSRIFTNLMNATIPTNIPQSEVFGHKARPVEFAFRSVVPSPLLPAVDLFTDRNTFGSPVVGNIEDKKKKGIPGYDMGSGNEQTLAVNRAKTLQSFGLRKDVAENVANPAKGLNTITGGLVDAAPQQVRLLNTYFNPTAEAIGFWRDITGQREPGYEGDIVNPIERRFTGKASGFYDQDQFDELLSKATQAKYQATKQGITALSPEDQALAKSADMLNRVQSDANQMFKNSKLMTRERLNLLQARKRELILDGIRRYNEMRDRMPRN